MKKLFYGRKLRLATDFILAGILAVVFAVGFTSQGFIPIDTAAVEAVYRGNVENKNVSLMFNVYENADVVGKIVDTLGEFNVKATFFLGGCWADDNEKTLSKIAAAGHEIANHGYFHKDHKKLDYEGNKQEIALTEKMVFALCGVKTELFAPPSGSFSDVTLSAAADLGYKVVMWSSDTIDWRDSDEEKIFSRATKNLSNGELVLMHPKEHTLKVLPRILTYYKTNGYKVVSVSENIG